MPIYSLITPVYNGAAYIEETVLSVLNAIEQSGIKCEYFVIDDGSTDNTQALAWDLWRWEIRRRRVAKKLSLGWSNRTSLQAWRLWNEHASLQRLHRESIFGRAMFLVFGGAIFLANGPEG
jgi:cellulose synthase/poly-beta-1,6-N-acetylglucosamine synthase-like glycosyltransferase